MAKLFLNSLSGKVIENLHLTQYTIVRSKDEVSSILIKDPEAKLLNHNNKKYHIMEYNVGEEDSFKKDNRPIYLGCLIYSYARKHMYDSIIRDYDVIYMDTDSAFLEESEYKRF